MTPPRFAIAGVLGVAVLVLFAGPADAQFLPEDDPVTVSATFHPPQADPGDTVTLLVTAEVAEPYHIYGLAAIHDQVYSTTLAVQLPDGWETVGPVLEPEPGLHEDPSIGEMVPWHDGKVVFARLLRVPKTANLETVKVEATLDFMPCTTEQCLQPRARDATAELRIGPGAETDNSVAPEDPVSIRVEFAEAQAAPGSLLTLKATFSVEEPYHVYGIEAVNEYVYSTRIRLLAPSGWQAAGPLLEPKPKIHRDEGLGIDVPWHQDGAVLTRNYRVPADAKPGEVPLLALVDYMACTDTYCLDPTMKVAATTFTVADAPAVEAPTRTVAEPPQKSQALGALIIFAFLGGLGSILLPCVYPLIPLTVAFFTKHEGTRAGAIGRAVLFCLGIVITFTVLGVALGPAINALANSLWLNLFLFLLMIVLALSLLGMFDIQLPSSWTGKMQAAGAGASAFAPIFMGVAFSLASFSCTVGVIGPVIAGSAGDWGRSSTAMFSYSVGFALPFFLLALFPMLVSSMPRGGGWLNTLKVLLGFFEICFAGYYLWKLDLNLGWGIGSWEVILASWAVTVTIAGFYLLGKVVLPHDSPLERVSVPRAVGAIGYFTFGLILFAGLMGSIQLPAWIQGLLPPPPERISAVAMGGNGTVTSTEIVARARPEWADEKFHPTYGGTWWTTDYEHALEIGRKTGRRVLLNFTGIFCTNCRTMETGAFREEAVMAEFGEMVLADLFTDIPNEKQGKKVHTPVETSERYNVLRSEKYGTTANPYYVILSPDGEILADSGYEPDLDRFVEFLRTGNQRAGK